MAHLSRDARRKLGAMLLKVRAGYDGNGYTAEEREAGLVLEDRKLVVYDGPPRHGQPAFRPIGSGYDAMVEAAMSHYDLTGSGAELILAYGDRRIGAGRFLFPGEDPWYDRRPQKYAVTAVISLLVSLILANLKPAEPVRPSARSETPPTLPGRP